ncbi:MAG TPA: cation:proton antiporter [Steroidobacteraceae bacterium]|nr:cation:proton antiporter [Steroidobacteraceae bacterium]
MGQEGLGTILVLLAAVVAVVAAMRRLKLPPLLGYLAVGMLLGPHALGVVRDSVTTSFLAELGVVFLLFTLGLEFSLPRMIAMRGEVLGLGALQVGLTTLTAAALASAAGAPLPIAVVIGGAIAMSSTAIVVQQLTEQAEINRTHGRLAFSILLFQDLVFVLFLALATATVGGEGAFTPATALAALGKAALALLIVLGAGRWLARPLFFEIARHRGQELFTLAVLLVALSAAWITHAVGLSLELGAFLAGMLLAETEYRHQVEAVIRPFRDVLLGLFFITMGMLLDLRLLGRDFLVVSSLVVGLFVLKALVVTLVARRYTDSWFKSLRAGLVVGAGGEFGFALLALLVKSGTESALSQPLLAAVTVSMVASPLVIRHNKRIARLMLREQGPGTTALAREAEADAALARREHVILCGYGRVGQNIGRLLERNGHEYIAIDLDPKRVRAARQAGDAVVFGDSADEQVLKSVGLAAASVVVVTFADPPIALGIVRMVRRLRAAVPLLVRTADDSSLEELQRAGATEVVPETFEASLMLVSHVLLFLDTPVSQIVRMVGEIRGERYGALRSVFRMPDAELPDAAETAREELRTVVLPPGAWAVGHTLGEVRGRGAEVQFSAVRREGIVGRDPAPATVLREGDVVVIFGLPEALEHAEAVLLAG